MRVLGLIVSLWILTGSNKSLANDLAQAAMATTVTAAAFEWLSAHADGVGALIAALSFIVGFLFKLLDICLQIRRDRAALEQQPD